MPDYTYAPKLSQNFDLHFGPIIDNEKCLFTSKSNVNLIKEFFDVFKAKIFYGYYIEDVPLNDIENLFIFILIEEFLLLNSECQEKKSNNILIEYDMNYKPEQLGLLSNLFNCVNVHLNKRESP